MSEKEIGFFFFEGFAPPSTPPKKPTARRRRTAGSTGAKKKVEKGGVVVVGRTKSVPFPHPGGWFCSVFQHLWNQISTIRGWFCRA